MNPMTIDNVSHLVHCTDKWMLTLGSAMSSEHPSGGLGSLEDKFRKITILEISPWTADKSRKSSLFRVLQFGWSGHLECTNVICGCELFSFYVSTHLY